MRQRLGCKIFGLNDGACSTKIDRLVDVSDNVASELARVLPYTMSRVIWARGFIAEACAADADSKAARAAQRHGHKLCCLVNASQGLPEVGF